MALNPTSDAMPEGIWAIASALRPEQLSLWMDQAAAADCWTFRIPQATSAEAIRMLQRMRKSAPWLAVHAEHEWAKAVQADAVIAGSRSLPIKDLRQLLSAQDSKAKIQLGVATHNSDELIQAQSSDADFVFFSPIWDTPSKRGILPPVGLERLAEVAQCAMPVIALGGIQTAQQVADCKRAGAHGVAVLRAAMEPSLLAEMSSAWHG